jgi:bacterioferritin-associated ferredoxin
MIICSCNVFGDAEVRAIMGTAQSTGGAGQVFRHLGHEPQCGRCARTIRKIMREMRPGSGDAERPGESR